MKLTVEGLKDVAGYEKAGIRLPAYDVAALAQRTKESPRWIHFGIGNIFRIFMGTAADDLIEAGLMDTGITCVETFDFDVVDKIYAPYDNLALCVTLHSDGQVDKRVIGSLAEAVAVRPGDEAALMRVKELFCDPGLQMVSFTITEKGYELRNPQGEYFGFVKADLENGPAGPFSSAMTLVTAMLLERFKAGAAPLALVSMDNVSQNGKKLRESVLEVAEAWREKGCLCEEALGYIQDETKVSFPWSMIDKITPRPDESVGKLLTEDGMEDMGVVVTSRRTYIAPFVNAEGPQYLVVEDSFPNGRPPLEKAGIYLTDRDTVNASERMKVTVCLNPVHSALGPYGVLLGYEKFSDSFHDPLFNRLATIVAPEEGMAVVIDPKILSPQAFMEELMTERFPNPYIPDTPQRLCTDISQGLGVRFGVTVKAYVAKDGSAEKLMGVPLAVAGWLRYCLGVDDEGKPYELAPDPLNPIYQKEMLEGGIEIGKPESLTDQLKPILSNVAIFGVNLYEAGLGEKIEGIFRELISGYGMVRKTMEKYLG